MFIPVSDKDWNGTMLLEAWLAYWLEEYVRPVVKPSTYESYRLACEAHLIPNLGKIPMKDLTSRTIQHFFNDHAKTGNAVTHGPLSAKTMRNLRVVLDVALKQALAEDLIASNPVPLTAIKSVHTKQLEILTDDKQETLEQYLFNTKSIYHPAILMAMYTGLRRGEICALRWKNYNEETHILTVMETVRRLTNYDAKQGEPTTNLVFNDVKTDASSRDLLMPPILQEILHKQREDYTQKFREPAPEDFIFYSRKGGILDPDNLQHYFSRLQKKLGMEHVKFHALRHTFATRAIENGIDVSTVSGILGHANVTTTTQFYVHPREKAMRHAMQTISPIYQAEARLVSSAAADVRSETTNAA